jgi:hypothetical protein
MQNKDACCEWRLQYMYALQGKMGINRPWSGLILGLPIRFAYQGSSMALGFNLAQVVMGANTLCCYEMSEKYLDTRYKCS